MRCWRASAGRWLATRSLRATARAASATLVLLSLILATDRFFDPADLLIVVLFLAAVALAVGVVARSYWPLRHRPSDRQVARYIEERCPALEDRLASATDIAGEATRSALRGLVVSDAVRRTRDLNIDDVVSSRELRRSAMVGLTATVALVAIVILGLGSLGRIARTAWLYAFPYTAELLVEPGDARVVAGQPVRVWARLDGAVGSEIRSAPVMVMTTDDGHEQAVTMSRVGDGYELVLESVDHSFQYRVRSASVLSDAYAITALFPPEILQIDVEYRYPVSTRLTPRVETDGGDIYAPAGTDGNGFRPHDEGGRAGFARDGRWAAGHARSG